jgi:ABC-2 type transport system permease protein
MNRLLLKKAMHESALLFAACSSMLLIFCWARVWILCQFDLQQFEPLLEQLRPFEKYSPVPLEQLLTYTGSLAMTFNEPVLILCVIVWSISRGSDVVSGEINRGTLEMLLAQPISRVRLLLTHAVVCVSGLALLCGTAWLGLCLGILTNTVREQVAPSVELSIPLLPLQFRVPIGATTEVQTPLSTLVDPLIYAAPAFNLFSFGFFVLALSVLCSSFDRYRWRTIGIVIGLYVIQLLVFLLSKATQATAFLGGFTFFSAYQPDAIVHFSRQAVAQGWWLNVPADYLTATWTHRLGPLGMSGVLLGIGTLFFCIAAWRFRTRDVPAPL